MHTISEVPAAVPAIVPQLSSLLTRLSSMGSEMAFWRAKGHTADLAKFSAELARLNQHPDSFPDLGTSAKSAYAAFEQLHRQIKDLVGQVPFNNRVNLLHRALIPCYQQIYVLENLVASILCRLRHQIAGEHGQAIQTGSFQDAGSRRALRESFREIAPSWDRMDWNHYDDV
jgi:hypothetical protein